MSKIFYTEIGVDFKIKGNRLCFLIDNIPHWVNLPPKLAKNLTKVINDFIASEEEWNKLTFEQKAETYKEFMGS